jgi:hypothetical protein
MRGLIAIIAVAVVGFVIYKYAVQTGGAPSGLQPPAGLDPNALPGKAKGAWDGFYAQPWFWTFAVSAVAAVLGIITWGKIGGWGRAVVIIAAAVAVTVLVTR